MKIFYIDLPSSQKSFHSCSVSGDTICPANGKETLVKLPEHPDSAAESLTKKSISPFTGGLSQLVIGYRRRLSFSSSLESN